MQLTKELKKEMIKEYKKLILLLDREESVYIRTKNKPEYFSSLSLRERDIYDIEVRILKIETALIENQI
jgi:hypothetical protein